MYTFFAYLFSLFVIVLSVFITLFIKLELERMFQEKKDVLPFHICNVVIILMVAFVTHVVMTTYVIGNQVNYILQIIILLFIILPIYILGHFAFEKYKSVYRKYTPGDNMKVIILNEKYLKKKKPFSKLKNYNAVSKDK
ncbi:hypothetical protein F7731_22625 [Cytobacillus depressus]|uniref:Uncharacterized protein n=1 Tax=Cytobacillus depressus TaxID=1602942 RepID=A0A6L3V178_9BACI|nr:hypothetical protein F7731_22625 [Cytobacillus depressus]